MPQLKIYSYHPYHVYDPRITNILTEPRSQTRYVVYVAAYSKVDAARLGKDAQCGTASSNDLRVAGSTQFEALREATLFDKEGVVLVTSDRGGKKPVILAGGEDGAQAIGIIKPAEGRAGYVFEATAAEYAGRGSIAVGAEIAYVKRDVGYPEGVIWVGTDGSNLTDREMQTKIDVGDLTIIRSGFGDWYMAGR